MSVYQEIQESPQISFVEQTTSSNTENQLKMDIVKHIISVRKEANMATITTAKRREEREYLEGLLNEKKAEADKSLSLAEIQERLMALGS